MNARSHAHRLLTGLALATLGISGVAAAQVDTQPGGIFCKADLNRDLQVDAADLGGLIAAWGTGAVDFNGDGLVQIVDLMNFLLLWGTTN